MVKCNIKCILASAVNVELLSGNLRVSGKFGLHNRTRQLSHLVSNHMYKLTDDGYNLIRFLKIHS